MITYQYYAPVQMNTHKNKTKNHFHVNFFEAAAAAMEIISTICPRLYKCFTSPRLVDAICVETAGSLATGIPGTYIPYTNTHTTDACTRQHPMLTTADDFFQCAAFSCVPDTRSFGISFVFTAFRRSVACRYVCRERRVIAAVFVSEWM